MSRPLSVVVVPASVEELQRTCNKCGKTAPVPRGHVTDANQFYCATCHDEWEQQENTMVQLGRGNVLPDIGKCSVCRQWKTIFESELHRNAGKCRSCWRRVCKINKPPCQSLKRNREGGPREILRLDESKDEPSWQVEERKVNAAILQDSSKKRVHLRVMEESFDAIPPGPVKDTLVVMIEGIHRRDMEAAVCHGQVER